MAIEVQKRRGSEEEVAKAVRLDFIGRGLMPSAEPNFESNLSGMPSQFLKGVHLAHIAAERVGRNRQLSFSVSDVGRLSRGRGLPPGCAGSWPLLCFGLLFKVCRLHVEVHMDGPKS